MEDTRVTIWSDESLSLGEGPLTHHLRSSLVWCDINGSAVYERKFQGGETRKFDLPVMPSAFAIIDEHSVLVATDLDLRRLNLDTGATEPVVAFPEEDDMRANDGRTHPGGAFWIGTMAKDGRGKPGAIYRYFDGKLSKMIDQVVTPNSTCFAADGSFAYYTDTPGRVIWKVPTDPDTGEITGDKAPFVTFDGSEPGGPDGSVVDADGNLWNARWGGNAVDVYDPSGVRIHSYHVPARQPTCPAFIGDQLDRIVTTSAAVSIDTDARTEADGTVLEIHAPVRGRPEPVVRL
ncbi:MAG: SMP-30/gluconolactonase/LRE family protein [Proteobacteria bacterium]|jgi:sugar lactone lactonase YvrE|nr:SMP-30/gluconolactonase/LRE family protein [Pseudomonadota bacterium]MDA1301321.1 SMP-30/gluconolactonase/LRE family protein [Pseudomonadota bacterium]